MSEKPTALDAVKIQSRAVIPIVRALERELGTDRAHSIVGRAIAESYAEWQVKTVGARNSHPREVNIEEQFPVETEIVEDTDSTFAVNMSRCRFAEYFRTIGAADVGALLTCGVDFAAEAALRPDWEFRRTQTLMGGATHCDLRWRLRGSAEDGQRLTKRESFARQRTDDLADSHCGCVAR